MIVICPSCRAPSNTSEQECWVCRRRFDGTEPVLGAKPGARTPFRLADVRGGAYANERPDAAAWRQARTS